MFLIQFLFRTDEVSLQSIPPLPKHVSTSSLIRNKRKSSLMYPSSSKACFIFKSYSKLMKILSEALLLFQSLCLLHVLVEIDENPLTSIPPLPKHVSYSSLIRNELKSYLKHPSSSRACFFFSSCSKLMNVPSVFCLFFTPATCGATFG